MSLELEAAAREASLSRERLKATALELQDRLSPKRLIDDAVTGASSNAVTLIESAERAARRRPALTKYAGLAVGLLLVRKPIGRILGFVFRRRKRAPKDD